MRLRDFERLGFLCLSVVWLSTVGPVWAVDERVPDHAVVFMYHHVSETTPPATSVTPAEFDEQLDFLAENGFRIWPLPALVDSLRTGGALPDSVVALTFDDGYLSVYTEAFPRLRKRGWPFTVFVTTEAIDSSEGPVMNWDQLREMAAEGATIGSHALRHDHLQRLRPGESRDQWRRRLVAELNTAADRIGAEIGIRPSILAYPYGEFDTALRQLLRAEDWIAFGQQSGPLGATSDRTALPRFPVAAGFTDLDEFGVKAGSLPLPVLSCDPDDTVLDAASGADLRPVLNLVLTAGDYRADQVAAYAGGQGAIEVQVSGDRQVELIVRANEPLRPGRSRYNITAPSRDGRRWYWYSHPWILGEDHED